MLCLRRFKRVGMTASLQAQRYALMRELLSRPQTMQLSEGILVARNRCVQLSCKPPRPAAGAVARASSTPHSTVRRTLAHHAASAPLV